MENTILVVDDEAKIRDILVPFLKEEGFRVLTAGTGKQALQMAQSDKPDLVVLDWMLPEMSGIDVCRELRKLSQIGIIMLTAKTEEIDKIVGLEVGADDYLTKPFSLRELSARIRSVLRRTHGHVEQTPFLQRGTLTISESSCQVWKDGNELSLTPTEFKLLLTLAAKPGIVYSRLQLLQAAMEDDFLNYERTVDTHISHLRKKIEDDPANPSYILTAYGFGYKFGGSL
ncbi:DNA-binding response regulator [Paenibacillus pectinilyticus]|uniref:DNA-binding response regulator n=1 Tax=Paenibacillus pectinilyticus TaxID=512399 RepID=A0A1C1A717_9BACL|nr:response regulator transcription factor [Paenibacillus pectinilyticus]OCT16359.1 DNA-binding response regulator [Paenibacillus pectinilyticus]